MRRIRVFGTALLILIAAALIGISAGGSGGPAVARAASTDQQIGMKVLLITDSTDASTASGIAYADWANTLKREGEPYDTWVTNTAMPTLSSTASDGTQIANYEGVVVATSGTEGLTSAQWTTLQTFEHQFSVRQVTAYAVPSSDVGLTLTNGAGFSGTPAGAAFTASGSSVFPYLKSVAFDSGAFGYGGSPIAGANVNTLLTDTAGDSLLGIYTAPDGRETLFQTFNQNQYMLQSELLRHGELAWLTRNTYFGDQRNYLTTHIDDNFLADDVWSVNGVAGEVAAHSTDFLPADAAREVPSDVATAATWSRNNNFRIDMLFNGGGSVQYAAGCTEASAGDGGSGGVSSDCTGAPTGTDPLLAAFQANDPATAQPYTKDFAWINHTWDHPNLDQGCATSNYIQAEINQNTIWGSKAAEAGNPNTGGLGLSSSTDASSALGVENPNAVVTGEHSGLANLIPGNPGQVDPPSIDNVALSTTTPVGTVPAGTYVYAASDQFNTAAPGAATVAGPGESAASISTIPVTVTGTQSVDVTFDAVCKAADYIIYRAPYTAPPVGSPAGTAGTIGTWSKIGTLAAHSVGTSSTGDFNNPASTSDTTNGGAKTLTFTDTGAGTPVLATPLTEGTAVEGPYEQNPLLDTAFASTLNGGIKYFGADASKPYPNSADQPFATLPAGSTYGGSTSAAGAAFSDAGSTGIPRYPTNIYYNVSTNAEEIDEYNTLYLPAGDGTGQCAAPRTDCFAAGTAPITTIGPIVQSVDSNMFLHAMGNDPRPHYFHQTNLMSSQSSGTTGDGDGLYYETMNPLLAMYNQYFNSTAPIVQPTMAQTGNLLNEQNAWAAQTTVSGSIEADTVTVDNTGNAAIQMPLTGTTGGDAYAGSYSYWTSAPVGKSAYTARVSWPTLPTTLLVVTPPTGPAPSGPVATPVVTPPPAQPGTTPVLPKTALKKALPAIYYHAVQVKPKTVRINKHGKVTVSLKCVASRGKTAKGKTCKGTLTMKVSGKKVGHKFTIKSTKTDKITLAVPKVAQSATVHRRQHRVRVALTISTSQGKAKAKVTKGSLTIQQYKPAVKKAKHGAKGKQGSKPTK